MKCDVVDVEVRTMRCGECHHITAQGEVFRGLSRLEGHKLVMDTVRPFPHALSIKLLLPEHDWPDRVATYDGFVYNGEGT